MTNEQNNQEKPTPSEEDVQALIRRFREDDDLEAFFRLTDLYDGYLYRLMLTSVKGSIEVPPRTAGILVNETWVRVRESLQRVDYRPLAGVRFIKWLRAVALQVKRDLLRNRPDLKFEQALPRRVFGAEAEPPKSPINILIEREEQVEIDRAKGVLNEAIDQLNPVEQYVIYGRFYDRMTYKEISQRLYQNTERVDYLKEDVLREALRKLRRIYRKKYGIKNIPRIKK